MGDVTHCGQSRFRIRGRGASDAVRSNAERGNEETANDLALVATLIIVTQSAIHPQVGLSNSERFRYHAVAREPPLPFRGRRWRRNLGRTSMKKEEILAQVAAGQLSVDEAAKLLADQDTAKRGTLYCKVSAKGAMSLYGLQRMPVTLYVEQWDRLLGFADELRAFLKEHDSEFKRKER